MAFADVVGLVAGMHPEMFDLARRAMYSHTPKR
jgi:hypothetical protein